MTKPTGKKRGRPRKLTEFMIRLGEDQGKWDKWLRSMGLPKHSSSTKEVLEHRLPDVRNEKGKLVRPVVGDRMGDRSLTLPKDSWISYWDESDEDRLLAIAWARYFRYIDIAAEWLSPDDNGHHIKQFAMEDSRSRRSEWPPEFATVLGRTPVEFQRRLSCGELEISLQTVGREIVICVRECPLPPDEEEDLDPKDEPKGHWEGLNWIPNQT